MNLQQVYFEYLNDNLDIRDELYKEAAYMAKQAALKIASGR